MAGIDDRVYFTVPPLRVAITVSGLPGWHRNPRAQPTHGRSERAGAP